MLVEFGATNIIETFDNESPDGGNDSFAQICTGMNYGLGASVVLTLLESEIQQVAYDPALLIIHYVTCLDICPFIYVPFPKNIVP